jgi:hypothetical protein
MTILATIAGWLGIACVVAALFHLLRRSQPRLRALPRIAPLPEPMDIRPGALINVAPPGLVLTESQLDEVRLAVYGVSSGVLPYAALAIDYAGPSGLGQVAIVVLDGGTLEAIRPAIEQRVAAARRV